MLPPQLRWGDLGISHLVRLLPRRIATTFSLSEWDNETILSHTLTSSRISSPKSPTMGRKLPLSHLSVDYRLLIPCTNTSWSTRHQDEQSPYPSLALHPIWTGDWSFLQPLCEIGQWWREVEVSIRSRLCSRLESGKPPYKELVPILSTISLQGDRSTECFTPLKLTINEIFSTIKDQPWIRRLKLLQHNPMLPESKEYCSYHEARNIKPSITRPTECTWRNS